MFLESAFKILFQGVQTVKRTCIWFTLARLKFTTLGIPELIFESAFITIADQLLQPFDLILP